jgi:hypothetical protein
VDENISKPRGESLWKILAIAEIVGAFAVLAYASIHYGGFDFGDNSNFPPPSPEVSDVRPRTGLSKIVDLISSHSKSNQIMEVDVAHSRHVIMLRIIKLINHTLLFLETTKISFFNFFSTNDDKMPA